MYQLGYRTLLVLLVCVCIETVPTRAAIAQSKGGAAQTLTTEDNVSIRITYYPALEDKVADGLSNAPVVVLLHDAKGSRLEWDKTPAPIKKLPLPELLQDWGFAAITVDLRKHGDSKIPGREETVAVDDYPKMVLGDMGAVKEFLFKEHQAKKLNMAKLAVVGVGMSAPVAAGFADADWSQRPHDDAPVVADKTPQGQTIKALIMISPTPAAGRLQTTRLLPLLRKNGLAFMVIVGADDAEDKSQAKKCYDVMAVGQKKGDKDPKVVFYAPKSKDRGIELFARSGDPEKLIYNFLDHHLKSLSIPWQDRRSRLNRDE